MKVVPTFATLNYTDLPPDEPTTIDIAEKELQHKRFMYGPHPKGIRMQLWKSRVKPGLSVSVYMTPSQISRRPLLLSDVQYVDEIYNTVLTLQVSHNSTMNALFSNPFNVTLVKKNAMSDWGRSTASSKNKKDQTDEPGTFAPDTDRIQKAKVTYTTEDHEKNKEKKKKHQAELKKRKAQGKEEDGEENEEEEEDVEMGSGANYTKKKPKAEEKRSGGGKGGLVDLVNSVKMDAVTQDVINNHWLSALRRMDMYRMKYGLAPFHLRTIEVEVDSYTIVPKKKRKRSAGPLTSTKEYEEEDLEEGEIRDDSRSPTRKKTRYNSGDNSSQRRGGNNTLPDIQNHPMANRDGMHQHWDNFDHTGIDDEYPGGFQNSELDMEKIIRTKSLEAKTTFRGKGHISKGGLSDLYNQIRPQDIPPGYTESSGGGGRGRANNRNLSRFADSSNGLQFFKDAGELFGYPLPDQNEKNHLPYPNRMAPNADREEETTEARITNMSQLYNQQDGFSRSTGGTTLGDSGHTENDQIIIGNTTLRNIRKRKKTEDEALDTASNLNWSDDEELDKAKKKLKRAVPTGISDNIPNVIPGKTGGSNPYDTSAVLNSSDTTSNDLTKGEVRKGRGDHSRPPSKDRQSYTSDKLRHHTQQQQQTGEDVTDPLEDFELITVKTKIKHNVPIVPEIELGSIEIYEELGTLGYMWIWRTNDEFAGRVEPYMMWVIFDAPKIDGKLTSPVSGMIGMYQDYQSAKRELDLAVEDMRNPFYTIETTESRIRPDHKGMLGGENYVPLLESRQGYPRSLELNDLNLQRQVGVGGAYDYRYGGLPMRPRGYIPEDGPVNQAPSWDSGRLMDYTSDSYREAMPNVLAARQLNRQLGFGISSAATMQGTRGWNSPEEYLSSNMGRGGGGGGGGMSMGHISRPSRRPTYEVYDRMTHLAEYNANVQEAATTWQTLGRPTMHTPQGKFMFLQVNEKLNKIEKSKNVNESRVNACMDKLETAGSLLGGSPNPMLMGKLSNKGAGADGVFTSKVNPKSDASAYGMSVTSNVLSPNKEFCEEVQKELKNNYANVVKEIFTIGYKDVLHSQEYWYRKMVEQTFRTEIEQMRRRTARNKSDESMVLSDIPNFESMFSINITFPMNSSSVGLNKALDLYGLKFWTAEQVYLEFLKEVPGNIKNEDLLQMVTDTNCNSDLTYEGSLIRFTEGLEKALEYEKKKGIKEPAEGGAKKSPAGKTPAKKKKTKGGATKKDKKAPKKEGGGKISPEKKAAIKAKAKAKVKAKLKLKSKAPTGGKSKETSTKTKTTSSKSNQDNTAEGKKEKGKTPKKDSGK